MRRLTSPLILGLIILVMASPLTAMAAPTRQDVIITFTVTLIDGSGGAILHPGASVPKMSNTFDITNVLNTLDAWIAADLLMPDRFLIENITAWISGLFLNETASDLGYGGFLPYSGAPNATLTASGFAVQALTLLNRTDSIDSSILIDFVVNLQRTNATLFPETVGAFTDTINRSATVSATYFAIQILEEYDAISQMNTSLAINWLNSSQILSDSAAVSYGGFANGRNTTTADLQTTYMALRSLELLDALAIIDQTAAIDYILPHYREDPNYPQFYGGFANTPDSSIATHFATFYAVTGLQILGASNQLSSEDITNWVLSTQTLDGGFADVSSTTGFAPQTNLAISTLALLDQLSSLLLPVGPDLYVFPWWIVAVAVVVILIVLCIIIARRSEWF
ncbi:MAG: prenyltransferase/squalene oxidase repeat-containing protein [Candidatus Thorarchaeota archaeon]